MGKKYDGQLILLTFGWYGLGRMFIEGLRTDSLYIGDSNIRVSQALAALIFIVCGGLLIYFLIKKPTKELYLKPAPAEGEANSSDISFKELVEKIKGLFSSKKEENKGSSSAEENQDQSASDEENKQ